MLISSRTYLAEVALALALAVCACSDGEGSHGRPEERGLLTVPSTPSSQVRSPDVQHEATTSVVAPSAPAVEREPRHRAEAPPAPAALSVVALSSSELALSWESRADTAAVGVYEVYRAERLVAKVRQASFTDGGLRAAARACYSLRACNDAGACSPLTPPVCGQTRDTTPPTVPAQVAVTAEPGNQVVVAWGPSSDDVGVTGYEVRRGSEQVAATSSTSIRQTKLETLHEYCYAVRAFDDAGNRSPWSDPACVRIADTTPPTVPALDAKAVGEHEISLSWTAASDDVGVVRYEVERVRQGAHAAPTPISGTTMRDTGLTVATSYCYAVRACDGAGNCSAPSAAACAETPDLTPPSRPAGLAATAIDDRHVEVRWEPSTDNVGVVEYQLFRGGELLHRTGTNSSLRDGNLRPGVEYCYAVLAADAAGNRSGVSQSVCARTPDLTPPTEPGRAAAVSVSSSQLFLAWDPSTDDVGVAGYEVLRGKDVIATVTATRARQRNLRSNVEYCYSVRAFDAAGNRSTVAGPFCATTLDPTQLGPPSDLRVRRVSSTNVLLQWEPSEQAGVLYRIYAQGARVVGLTAASTYTPSGRLGAEPSCFQVAALDAQGRESAKSNEACAASGSALSVR
jgi:chitodextrinase